MIDALFDILTSPYFVAAAAGLNVGALVAALALRVRYGVIATRSTFWPVNLALVYLIVANAMTGVPFELRPALWAAIIRVTFLVGYLILAWGLVSGAAEAKAFKRAVRGA